MSKFTPHQKLTSITPQINNNSQTTRESIGQQISILKGGVLPVEMLISGRKLDKLQKEYDYLLGRTFKILAEILTEYSSQNLLVPSLLQKIGLSKNEENQTYSYKSSKNHNVSFRIIDDKIETTSGTQFDDSSLIELVNLLHFQTRDDITTSATETVELNDREIFDNIQKPSHSESDHLTLKKSVTDIISNLSQEASSKFHRNTSVESQENTDGTITQTLKIHYGSHPKPKTIEIISNPSNNDHSIKFEGFDKHDGTCQINLGNLGDIQRRLSESLDRIDNEYAKRRIISQNIRDGIARNPIITTNVDKSTLEIKGAIDGILRDLESGRFKTRVVKIVGELTRGQKKALIDFANFINDTSYTKKAETEVDAFKLISTKYAKFVTDNLEKEDRIPLATEQLKKLVENFRNKDREAAKEAETPSSSMQPESNDTVTTEIETTKEFPSQKISLLQDGDIPIGDDITNQIRDLNRILSEIQFGEKNDEFVLPSTIETQTTNDTTLSREELDLEAKQKYQTEQAAELAAKLNTVKETLNNTSNPDGVFTESSTEENGRKISTFTHKIGDDYLTITYAEQKDSLTPLPTLSITSSRDQNPILPETKFSIRTSDDLINQLDDAIAARQQLAAKFEKMSEGYKIRQGIVINPLPSNLEKSSNPTVASADMAFQKLRKMLGKNDFRFSSAIHLNFEERKSLTYLIKSIKESAEIYGLDKESISIDTPIDSLSQICIALYKKDKSHNQFLEEATKKSLEELINEKKNAQAKKPNTIIKLKNGSNLMLEVQTPDNDVLGR